MRLLAFLLPIAASIATVDIVARVVPAPSGQLALYLAWWVGISGVATVVLILVERLARRLLPLAALFKLSLVFPDAAPSRFQVALKTSTVEELEERIAGKGDVADAAPTPAESAEELLALVRSLDKHDRLTRGHSERVRAYAQLIAQELHLSPEERDRLNWAALLHDVGKLRVPTEILTKPSRPTDEEWQVLRKHTEYGNELVAPLRGWLGPALDAVGQHHERWDGKGYPHGLKEDEISLYGRIVAVADTYDVITSSRSYKSSQTAVDGRDELAKCAGAQFDPKVVRAFMNISLGRLRLVMGPLSWLAHAPILGRIPLTPAIGTVAGSLGTVAAAVSSGVIGAPPPPATAQPVTPSAALISVPLVNRSTPENSPLRITLPAHLQANVRSLQITAGPGEGTATVVDGTIRYVPARGFHGTVAIRYRVCWTDGGCGTGTIVVRVLPGAQRPSSRPRPGPATHGDRGPKVAVTPIVDTPTGTNPPPPNVPAQDQPATAPADDAPPPAPPAENRDPVAVSDTFSLPEGGSALISLLANDRDPDGDTLTLQSLSSPAHDEAVAEGDRLRFRATETYAGPVSFSYVVSDGHGGTDTGSVTVHVLDVNAPPTFSAGADQAVPEDSGARSVPGWASAISPGPASESGQKVAFTAETDNTGLFAAQPAVAADGALAFTPAPNANGVAHVSVRAHDDGGLEFGGNDTSAAQQLTITVSPVNDAPSFTKGADQTVAEDAGAQSVSGWATAISPGPANESGQAVSFPVSTTNAALFTTAPAVAANGTLTYTPAPNANGTATVTVRARDDGGTASGGADTSAAATFTVTVTPVDDAPVAVDDAVSTAQDGAGTTFDVLANDTDVDTGDVLALDSFDASGVSGGTLTHGSAGSFTYVPDPGFLGTETFTYAVRDTSGATDSGSVTITVTPVPHAPLAADDAYTTPQGTQLTEAAPGLLVNDGDQDGDTLSVQTTPVSGPANGSLTLAADGSFTYTPGIGFTGDDTFTYRVDDGTGRSSTAAVTITVTSTAPTSLRLYLQNTGPTADLWSISSSLPSNVSTFADLDGDGKAGLTIKKSDGKETVTDPKKQQWWAYSPSSDLVLDGPLTLELWSGTVDLLKISDGRLYTYVYDCTAGGASCTKIASNTLYKRPWDSLLSSWTFRSLTVGAVSRTILAGHELRVRILFDLRDFWVMTSSSYPSSVLLTVQ